MKESAPEANLVKEQQRDSAINRIAHAQNFDELFLLIKQIEKIENPKKPEEPWLASYLIEAIRQAAEDYYSAKETGDENIEESLSCVPKAGGLRSCVRYFLEHDMQPPQRN
ncbi:MAG: hypothetical protein V4699_01070 [Patescibacteria group bacterium]